MKKILVGLDGSGRQKGILAAATALARRTGSKLVLFRAVSIPTELPPEAYLMPPTEVTKILERRARVALEEAARDVPGELAPELRIALGQPWQAICAAATECDADLIVIGSHGYDTIDRLLGTTAAKVVNHADRTVLVVRAPERLTD
ncbi:MAG: universal stress protein [Labilithrix sp.]|nr:universal stress protein [Labilithrix sp.]